MRSSINKICILLIIFSVFLGVSWGEETDISAQSASLGISQLSVVIHVTIKNNNDHVEYFKISQQYFQTTPPINWTIDWTSPEAVKMVKSASPELGGDYGWKINPGETKTVSFKLSASGGGGNIPGYMNNLDAETNQYWPLLPEPGFYSSMFMPNEIEVLNPDLDLQSWKGTFNFRLTNFDTNTVSGILRAPIVPLDSKLTYSNPQVTFTDDLLNSNVAAWDVTMAAGASRAFTYTYQWPLTSTTSTSSAASASLKTTSTAKTPTSVPNENTGVPVGLLVVGAIFTVSGALYAKFLM